MCSAASRDASGPRKGSRELTESSTIVWGGASCQLTCADRCFTDGIGEYANRASCGVRAERDVHLTASFFDTETYFDRLAVYDGVVYTYYSGRTGRSWDQCLRRWYDYSARAWRAVYYRSGPCGPQHVFG